MAYDRTKFTFMRQGHVFIGVADAASTAAADPDSIGCVSGAFTVNDSYASDAATPFENWCEQIAAEGGEAGLAQVTLGDRTIEFSATLEMDLSDTTFRQERTAYTQRTPRQFTITWSNVDGDEQTLVVNGVYTAWPTTVRDGEGGAGTTQVTLSFHANEVITDEIVPGD